MPKKAKWYVVTGLDGSGKTTLVKDLSKTLPGKVLTFRLPHFDFVLPSLKISGDGTSHGDSYTDRLLFAADARLTSTLIRTWRNEYDFLVSQRGWMDNFIFAAVQGYSYEETARLLRLEDLEMPDLIIYLNANPMVAFERIKDDAKADKYETLEFMKQQAVETTAFWEAVNHRDSALTPLFGVPSIFIDTTNITPEETFKKVQEFLAIARE